MRNNCSITKAMQCGCQLLLALTLLLAPGWPAWAQQDQNVLQGFETQADEKAHADDVVTITNKEKHAILFFMGIALLVGVLVTASLGIAMGIYGAPVFVAHMLFAGLSVTLAIIHAIVAIVWFYPF